MHPRQGLAPQEGLRSAHCSCPAQGSTTDEPELGTGPETHSSTLTPAS